MTIDQFKKTGFYGEITFEQYNKCDCSKCTKKCIHQDCFRRYPKTTGGLGLCENLKTDLGGVHK